MYYFTCPHCNKELDHEEDVTGCKVECSFCSEKFIVQECVLDQASESAASEKKRQPGTAAQPDLKSGQKGKASEILSQKYTEKSKFSLSALIFLAIIGAGGFFGFKWYREQQDKSSQTGKKRHAIILRETPEETSPTVEEPSAVSDLKTDIIPDISSEKAEETAEFQPIPEEFEATEETTTPPTDTAGETIVPDGPFTATIVFTASRDIIPPKGDKMETVLAVIETNKDAVGLTKDDIKVKGGIALNFRKRNPRLYDLQLRAEYQPGDITVTIEPGSCADKAGNKLAEKVEARLPVAWAPWYGTAKRYSYIVRGRGGPEALLPIGIGNDNQMLMKWINPGTYYMGSKGPDFGPYAAKHHQKNEDYHKVTITRGFWISSLECSQNQWESIMGDKPSYFKRAKDDEKQLPVESVSWYDVQKFLKKLNEKIPGLNARLPTEAEWEYCCRSGTTTAFYCGPDDIRGDAHSRFNLSQQSWYAGNSADWNVKKRTEKIPVNYVDISTLYKDFQFPIADYKRFAPHHIGLKSKSDWGLGDFSGNVAEWCQDVYIDNLGPADKVDPLITKGGSKRVVRGGSWKSAAADCRSASRVGMDPHKKYNTVGFRIVIPGDVVLSK